MQYVNLGKAGVKVSRICLGCMSFGNAESWMIEVDKTRPIVKCALDLGITFFDTANVYSKGRAEEIIGELLKDYREDVVIATKVYGQMGEKPNQRGLSRVHIMNQIKASLKRLQTDYVDLYQIHRWDYTTPIEETLRTLDGLVHEGMVRYIGASSMFAWQFLKALHTSDRLRLERFVSMQNHYNLCYREEEREMIPLCREEGIGLIPWSPLARGFLTGKYKRKETPSTLRYESDTSLSERFFKPEDFDIVESVETLAREKHVTPAQVALAWLFHKGITAPIIGATKVEHIEEAVGALDVKLDADEINRLEAHYVPHPVLGHQ
ncbi:MAG TPA: aldo/keto reductase [Candidatus Bathyarchaeia archaeon]|nr:aldo/keto reductase [Candidatus Bathyarchaeia archaeon]